LAGNVRCKEHKLGNIKATCKQKCELSDNRWFQFQFLFFWMEWHAEEGCKGHCLLAVTPALLANSSKYLGLFGSGQTLLLLGKGAGRKLFQSERAEGADKRMMDMKTQTMTDNTDTQAMRTIAHLPRNMRRE
jgi:hypothetical protein